MDASQHGNGPDEMSTCENAFTVRSLASDRAQKRKNAKNPQSRPERQQARRGFFSFSFFLSLDGSPPTLILPLPHGSREPL